MTLPAPVAAGTNSLIALVTTTGLLAQHVPASEVDGQPARLQTVRLQGRQPDGDQAAGRRVGRHLDAGRLLQEREESRVSPRDDTEPTADALQQRHGVVRRQVSDDVDAISLFSQHFYIIVLY